MQTAPFVVRTSGGDGGAVTRRFGAETLLVPVCAGVGDLDSVYTLNEVATAIWDRLEQPTTVAHLVDMVAADYDVSTDQARGDVDAFLADLSELGLVRLIDPAADAAGSAAALADAGAPR